jgi:putative transposase
MSWLVSTGPGNRWMGRRPKRRSGGKKTGPNPTDRGKLGVKRSVLTDARGVAIGVAIDGANRHDCKLVEATLQSIPIPRPPPDAGPQNICLDKGYDYPFVRELVRKENYIDHVRARGEDVPDPRPEGHKPRRWVVERLHSWTNRFRRLLVRWERKGANYLAMLHFACGIIAHNAAQTFQRSEAA